MSTAPSPRPKSPRPATPIDPGSAAAPIPTGFDRSRPVLVLGGTGGFGGAVALELLASEYKVRLLVRDTKRAITRFGAYSTYADYVQGDVVNAARLTEAASGCSAIVHAVNVPYDRWDPFMRQATEAVIAAARAHSLMILFPGNVYVYGPAEKSKGKGKSKEPAPPVPIPEGTPLAPTTKKGRFRAELESMLEAAAKRDGCRVIVLRAGDYFGPTVRNPYVDGIFGRAVEGRAPRIIGNLSAPHQWAYVPDLAFAARQILENSKSLRGFQCIHFAGHAVPSQREFLQLVCEKAGMTGSKFGVTGWGLVRIAGWFSPITREVFELRPIYDGEVSLAEGVLKRLAPEFKPTPLGEAIQSTLQSYRADMRARGG